MNGLGAHEGHNRTTGAGVMIAQSVADILGQHVKLSVEGIDRMYLNVYVPRLQIEQGVVGFFREHRGQPAAICSFDEPDEPELCGEAGRLCCRAPDSAGVIPQTRTQGRRDGGASAQVRQGRRVLFVGKAQEKTPVFRTEKRRSPTTGRPYPWIVRSTVNRIMSTR